MWVCVSAGKIKKRQKERKENLFIYFPKTGHLKILLKPLKKNAFKQWLRQSFKSVFICLKNDSKVLFIILLSFAFRK